MLKIVCIANPSGEPETVLVAEGRLVGLWVEELRNTAAVSGFPECRVALDLAGVGYADAQGQTLLLRLLAEGIAISAMSPYVKQLLEG